MSDWKDIDKQIPSEVGAPQGAFGVVVALIIGAAVTAVGGEWPGAIAVLICLVTVPRYFQENARVKWWNEQQRKGSEN